MKPLLMLVIGLFFGTGGGFLYAASQGITLDGHDHGDHSAHDMAAGAMSHDHDALLPAGDPAPSLKLHLSPEGDFAWNLHIVTEHFRFAPEDVNAVHVPGEGHAHIYVDGVKLNRVYGPWYHLTGLPEDAREIRVTLNANSHETLSVDGAPVAATVRLRP
ncbi:MAG: hypothetical protein CMH12_15510 [Maritimibacter sp.]|nr:hypothetical protein [Maritimibacter sp.]